MENVLIVLIVKYFMSIVAIAPILKIVIENLFQRLLIVAKTIFGNTKR